MENSMPTSLECVNLRHRLGASDILKHNLPHFTGYLAACLIALSASCQAQANGYLYDWAPGPNSNPAPVEYGYVEQADGHLHLEIPIGEPRHNRSGSGTTQVRLVYDSNLWNPNNYFGGTSYNWEPGASWHLLPTFATYGTEGLAQTSDYYWGEIDENGISHYFPCNWEGCYSTEGHGYWWDGGGNVYGPDGSLLMIDLLEPDGRVTDANGNYTSLLGGETLPQVYGEEGELNAFDTDNIPFLEEYDVTPSGATFNSPGPFEDYLYHVPSMNAAGGTEDYLEHEVSIQVNTAFSEARYPVAECVNSGSNTCIAVVVSQIILPDQTSFTFKYDCDSTIPAQHAYCTSPGGQAAYYGVLTEMITPTGGIYTYSYKPFLDVYADATLGLQSRSNGYGTWQYSEAALSQCGGPNGDGTWNVGCEQTLTTVEPNGRTTVTTNVVNKGPWPVSELVTDGAGHNLSLSTTTWDFSHPNLWFGYGSAYIQKQSETQTLWDSAGTAETKKTAYTYDSPQTGHITILQQWGYYPGTAPSFSSIADITTYTSYYAPGNSPIVDNTMWGVTKGGTNVIDKPTSITVCNNAGTDSACPGGGRRVSQELITYDQYGPTQVNGIANHDDHSYGSNQLGRLCTSSASTA
jgi:hypothetical protein